MNKPALNKDTTVCISLAARPSNLGTRFHNRLYEEFGLDFLYKAFTTTDIEGAIRGVRALGIRGCSVSMPFKAAVIPLVDHIEESAAAIEAVNTIVNDDGVLTAANTDVEAVRMLLDDHAVDRGLSVAIRGSGSMASAVVAAFRSAGFDEVTVIARNAEAGRVIADRSGYRWAQEPAAADLLVNVTPMGMAGPDADVLSFPAGLITAASMVFDVVALPAETPLILAARAAGIPVITGNAVHALQAALQFERYTGLRPTADQVAAAHRFATQS